MIDPAAQTASNSPIAGAPSTAGAEGEATGPIDAAFESEVAGLVVEALDLDVDPAAIDPNARLYGEGLGLDSIDILEIALVVSKKYGFQLRSDDDNNQRIFRSLRNLSQHIAVNRTR